MAEPARLDLTRQRVEKAAERIQDQAVLIEWLKKEGHDSALAEQLLVTFLSLVDQLATICERLEREADAQTGPLSPSEG